MFYVDYNGLRVFGLYEAVAEYFKLRRDEFLFLGYSLETGRIHRAVARSSRFVPDWPADVIPICFYCPGIKLQEGPMRQLFVDRIYYECCSRGLLPALA